MLPFTFKFNNYVFNLKEFKELFYPTKNDLDILYHRGQTYIKRKNMYFSVEYERGKGFKVECINKKEA